ncbi:MAG TPA: extracellular solute-binding protein [Alphaproteobacteria bacterium]|nr:extracellular solute-binding protein [Alphaproteobacteria bacterium]
MMRLMRQIAGGGTARWVQRLFSLACIGGCWLHVSPISATDPRAPSPIVQRFDGGGGAKYAPDFSHFDYADPIAPKGGAVRLMEIGTYDSFNPFVLSGSPPPVMGLTYDTIAVRTPDDPFSRYCLVCATAQLAPDRRSIEFNLRPDARFHDGTAVTADDVIWTYDALRRHGHPHYRTLLAAVEGAEPCGRHCVRFRFTRANDRELPLVTADLPVLPRHWWQNRTFERSTLEPFLGSGPYRIARFEPGRYLTLSRAADYWAKDHPVNRGRYNFDHLRIDYFRDDIAARSAFLAGEYDIRLENQPRDWKDGYESPALARDLIRREEIPEDRVSGMQGFVFNTRRAFLADRHVREALVHAFDFESLDRLLLQGQYKRNRSYFNNADFGAHGAPGDSELALLAPHRAQLPAEVFEREYQPPRTAAYGDWRANRRIASRLLAAAGYVVLGYRLTGRDGRPVSIEILLDNSRLERVALPYVDNLRKLGIAATVRTVDTAQFQRRLERFDFDIAAALLGQSEAPGREQAYYWGSAAANEPGSLNLAGVRDPAVDALVDRIANASDRASLVTATRALDRVLQWGHYVVPFWHSKVDRVAYWDRFGRPAKVSVVGFDVHTWWFDARKDAALRRRLALD